MPPRKTKKAPPAPPLDGCRIALSGTFPGQTQGAVIKKASDLGATSSSSVTQDTTHLITNQADFDKPSTKVAAAKKLGIHIVTLQWLEDSESTNAKEDESKYSFLGAAALSTQNGVASQNGAASQAAPSAPKARATRKRAVSPPPTVPTPAAPATPPAAAPIPMRKKARKADDTTAADKADNTAAVDTADDTIADDQAPKIKDEEKKPGRAMGEGQLAKRSDIAIPLDEGCPYASHMVFIDPTGVIYDASLNQTNASNNNNKFYRIQLLHSNYQNWVVWMRWGRVGDRGQTKAIDASDVGEGILLFDSKFKSKSGLSWADRGNQPKPKCYTFIEKSYAVESDDEDEVDTKDKDKGEGYKPPVSALQPAVQQLVQLIFNQQFFAAAMEELNYDVNKMPLGKLSKATITRGFQALKDLSALLDDPSLAANYNMSYNPAVESLSNSFYSFIPHAFGRNRPPIINSQDMLKKEIELLESLSDMKDAALIMKLDKGGNDGIHPLDKQYAGLGMKEMSPLDPTSGEYTQLREYLMNTRGATHVANYQVEAIFRIERNGEGERFNDSIFSGPPKDRRLLWHGSRCTNFGGILSQGLRIAPPEAPVSGYMFGKGVYLADMSSKSANYCYPSMSNRTALLLLCEAELGDPMQKLTNASYNAGEDAKKNGMHSTWGQGNTGPSQWKDASCVHPSLSGVKMPDTAAAAPGATNVPGAYLLYNEYICYDIAQIRLRYLFRVRM
ncbi:PARP-domain-containing protein [Thozetella sp. PMI_491]|nr:PARP-domain-containing protein [Thozetella sp. PMI_491]